MVIAHIKFRGLLFLFITIQIQCQSPKPIEGSDENIREEVLKAFNEMYDTYSEGTDEYFKYFEQDFVRVGTDGNIISGLEQPKTDWNELLSKYKMKLISYGQPKLVIGTGQVVTINSYDEMFINNESSDTIFVEGIYIATWRRQNDANWKISMDTWHAKQE